MECLTNLKNRARNNTYTVTIEQLAPAMYKIWSKNRLIPDTNAGKQINYSLGEIQFRIGNYSITLEELNENRYAVFKQTTSAHIYQRVNRPHEDKSIYMEWEAKETGGTFAVSRTPNGFGFYTIAQSETYAPYNGNNEQLYTKDKMLRIIGPTANNAEWETY